jgi:hypothetical protein
LKRALEMRSCRRILVYAEKRPAQLNLFIDGEVLAFHLGCHRDISKLDQILNEIFLV